MASIQPDLLVSGDSPAFVDPLIKYAGGKRWLVKLLAIGLHQHLSKTKDSVYVEPFAGSLAMGLALGWPRSVYADTSPDLANLHTVARDDPAGLVRELDVYRKISGEGSYYIIRKSIWPDERIGMSSGDLAARTIWLNKNSFNGLNRTNRDGKFNVPWGKRENVALPTREHVEVVCSNSWTDEICDLYRDGFALFQVGVQHSVGATGGRRGKRAEMVAVSEAHAGVLRSTPIKRIK